MNEWEWSRAARRKTFSSPEPRVPLSRRGLCTRVRRPTGPPAQPPAAKRTRRVWGREWAEKGNPSALHVFLKKNEHSVEEVGSAAAALQWLGSSVACMKHVFKSLLCTFGSQSCQINTIKSAIPQRQTNEWCRITCRPGSANYLKYKILTADWSQRRRLSD